MALINSWQYGIKLFKNLNPAREKMGKNGGKIFLVWEKCAIHEQKPG